MQLSTTSNGKPCFSIGVCLLAFLLISIPVAGQNHLVIKPGHSMVLDADPGPLSYILVQGHLYIDYAGSGELRANRIIIDGGHLEIGKPGRPYRHMLDIVIGGPAQIDTMPALVLKNEGRLDIHSQFDEAGNNLITLQSAQPEQTRNCWIRVEEDAKYCQLSSIDFAGFASIDQPNSATLKWSRCAGFMRYCNFRDVQGQQIWLDQTSIHFENNQIKSMDGAALILAASGRGAGNLIRNNRFEVATQNKPFLSFAIQIGHPVQQLENNSLLVENCKVGLLYSCYSSNPPLQDSTANFSLKDNKIYQSDTSDLFTTGLQFDNCGSQKEWLSQANQIKGFALGVKLEQNLILDNWDLADNVMAMESTDQIPSMLVRQHRQATSSTKDEPKMGSPAYRAPSSQHEILARITKLEKYFWRLLYGLIGSQ